MTLAPFEVERREFATSAFGYRKREVDTFLAEVHSTLGNMWEERARLREELERLTERSERYAAQEHQLVETLRLAQESATRATDHARKEADLTLRDAKQQARDIVHGAHEERTQLDAVVRDLRAAEREARHRLRSLASAVLTGIDDDEQATEAQAKSLRAIVSGLPSTPTSGRTQPVRRSAERIPAVTPELSSGSRAKGDPEDSAAVEKPFGQPPRFVRSERAERVSAPSGTSDE